MSPDPTRPTTTQGPQAGPPLEEAQGAKFTLRNDAPPPTRARFDSEPTRQRKLLDGLDCLPGQLDLF